MIPALILEHPQISSILTAWLPILYAGVMSCGVAYTLQVVGQKNVNPTVASLILSLESCISVLAGWVLLNQKLSIKELLGCVLSLIHISLLPSGHGERAVALVAGKAPAAEAAAVGSRFRRAFAEGEQLVSLPSATDV